MHRALAAMVLVAACGSKVEPRPAADAASPAVGVDAAAPLAEVASPQLDLRATPALDVAPSPDTGMEPSPDLATGSDGGSCAGLTICEGFETTAPGALPMGWGRRPGGYGGRSIGVVSDDRFRGQRALKIEGGVNGSQFIEWKGALGPLATNHWGRVYFKVKTPAPWPASGVLHGDLVQHVGPHPGGGSNFVRWGIVENPQMKFQWIYNVQPTQGEPEFADGTAYVYSWAGAWQCLEWRYDQPAQQGMLWLDGQQVPIQVGKSHLPEIPVFTSLGVGWANYQNAPGEGFVVWIDEVAFDEARIGCDR